MKILMVCLGNICRSPVAEGIMRQRASEAGLELDIASCGTASYHIGEAPDHRSQKSTKRIGVDISSLRARHFKRMDFTDFDHILCMDKTNLTDLMKLAETESEKRKVHLFMEAAFPSENVPVPDPYYGSEQDFNEVVRIVEQGCDAWINKLLDS